MNIENSFEKIPDWHDSVASQIIFKPKVGILKKLGKLTSHIVRPTKERLENRFEFNTDLPTRTSTPEEVAEFERKYINSSANLDKFTETISQPQTPTPTTDVA